MASIGQVEHASEWIADWYNTNKVILKTKGIPASDIWDAYALTTNFPMGYKSFFPLLHSINIAGGSIQKIRNEQGTMYIVME